MGRNKKVNKIPHNVKERFRHQNLQRLLENVASHVPEPMSLKKETKAKKLRRIVLYMKFLLHKKAQLSETTAKAEENVGTSYIEKNKEIEKVRSKVSKYSQEKLKSRHPQIVFLRKSSQTSDQSRLSPTEENRKASCTITHDPNDSHISTANESTLDDAQEEISSSNCYPMSDNLNWDIHPYWNRKTNATTFEHLPLHVFKTPWVKTTPDKTRTSHFPSSKENLPETGLFDKLSHNKNDAVVHKRIYDPESIFEDPNMDNTFLYGNSQSNIERNVYQSGAKEISNKHTVLRNDNLPLISTISHSAMFYPNTYIGDANNVQKNVAFFQDGENLPLELVSSEESAPMSSGEWFSSDGSDFVNKMSQESANCNATIFGSEDSFDNCRTGKTPGCDIFRDPTETFCDMGQYANFKQATSPLSFYAHGSGMDLNLNAPNFSPDYATLAGNRNTSGYKDIQNVIQPVLVRQSDVLSFQQNNPAYYQVYPVCDNAETKPRNDLHEGYYPFAQDEIAPLQNCLGRPHKDSKCLKIKDEKASNDFVPNGDCLLIDSQEDGDFFGSSVLNEPVGCSSRQESSAQFGHSSFKVGDECDLYPEMKIKQEEPESSLLSEEISYSLNNLDTWYENYFNIQQAQ